MRRTGNGLPRTPAGVACLPQKKKKRGRGSSSVMSLRKRREGKCSPVLSTPALYKWPALHWCGTKVMLYEQKFRVGPWGEGYAGDGDRGIRTKGNGGGNQNEGERGHVHLAELRVKHMLCVVVFSVDLNTDKSISLPVLSPSNTPQDPGPTTPAQTDGWVAGEEGGRAE